MQGYVFDQATGLLISTIKLDDATNNPDDRPDVTLEAPPSCPAGQAPQWDGEAWSCVQWPPPPTLDEAKADAWKQIKARRLVAFAATAVSVAGIPYSITHDKDNLADRIVSLSAAIAIGAASTETEIEWRDRNNDEHLVTIVGLNALAAEMGDRGQAIFKRSWTLDAAVQAATDLAGVEAALAGLDTGWP